MPHRALIACAERMNYEQGDAERDADIRHVENTGANVVDTTVYKLMSRQLRSAQSSTLPGGTNWRIASLTKIHQHGISV